MDETSAIIVGQDLLPEWAVSRLAGEVGHCVQLTGKFLQDTRTLARQIVKYQFFPFLNYVPYLFFREI